MKNSWGEDGGDGVSGWTSWDAGGRSDVENDFCFFPFRPGEMGRFPLSVENEAPGRRVASEFCSVIGYNLCGVCFFGDGVSCKNEAGTALPVGSMTVSSHDAGACSPVDGVFHALLSYQLMCSVLDSTNEAS